MLVHIAFFIKSFLLDSRNNLDRCLQEAESLEHELSVTRNRLNKVEPQLKVVTKQRDDFKDQYEATKRRLNALKEDVSCVD